MHSCRKNKFIFSFSSGPLPRSLMTDKCESAYVNVQYTLRRNWLTGLQSSMLCLSKKHMFNFPLKWIVKDFQSSLRIDWEGPAITTMIGLLYDQWSEILIPEIISYQQMSPCNPHMCQYVARTGGGAGSLRGHSGVHCVASRITGGHSSIVWQRFCVPMTGAVIGIALLSVTLTAHHILCINPWIELTPLSGCK